MQFVEGMGESGLLADGLGRGHTLFRRGPEFAPLPRTRVDYDVRATALKGVFASWR